MTTWNHRVVDMTAENDGETLFAIREVHYRNGRPAGHGEPSMVSESMDGLEWLVDEIRDALRQPVMKPEDFNGGE